MSERRNNRCGSSFIPGEQEKTSALDGTNNSMRANDDLVGHIKMPSTTPSSTVHNAGAPILRSATPNKIFQQPYSMRGQGSDSNINFSSAQELDDTTSQLSPSDSFGSLFADGNTRPRISPASQTSSDQAVGGAAQQLPLGGQIVSITAKTSQTQIATLTAPSTSFRPLPVSFIPGDVAGDMQRQVAEMPSLTPRLISLLQVVLQEDLAKQAMEEIRSTLPSSSAEVVADLLRQVDEMPNKTPRIKVLLGNVLREEVDRRALEEEEHGYGEDAGAGG